MSHIDQLPPLRDVISKHNIAAQKSLGQNFLLDLNLTHKIAGLAGDLSDTNVLEIGPGPGGLTRGLLARGAKKVLAIEKDPRCMAALAEISNIYPNQLEVLNEDALNVDVNSYLKPPIKVAANLPYNVGTELLVRWLTPPSWPPFWESLTLMFQKEVAQRITAQPGSKAYGRLSLLAQWRSDAYIAMELPPQAFSPPPKVHSSVVHITARSEPKHPAHPQILQRVIAAAFNQRRKMLRSSLKSLTPKIEDHLQASGIAATERAERIDLEGFCNLARSLEKDDYFS